MTGALFFIAQVTIAVFAAATDPNTSTPLAPPVVYASPRCDQPRIEEVVPIVNPVAGVYADPANSARDCVVDVTAQIAAIPVGAGYHGAMRMGTAGYGPLSTAFAITAQPAHPCDSLPLSPVSVAVGQPFTVGWCHTNEDTNHAPTTITGWRVYLDGVLMPASATVSAANSTGLVYVSVPVAGLPAALYRFELAAVNAVGEGPRSAAVLVVIHLPPAVPQAPSLGRVTLP